MRREARALILKVDFFLRGKKEAVVFQVHREIYLNFFRSQSEVSLFLSMEAKETVAPFSLECQLWVGGIPQSFASTKRLSSILVSSCK